ncbi:MAG: hypothetical protein U0L73_02705 [Ruminococcus bromii]|nr:hypothetical protein [Ruminococcus bromii]
MMKYIEKARKLRKIIESAIASVDDKTSSEATELLPVLKNDNTYIKAGTRINYNGKIKKATVDLWDIEANNPDNAPVLWEDILYKDGYRIIPDVLSVTTAFSKGETGWWKDKLYTSLVDYNVYTPEQYAPNWEEV